MQCWKGGKFKQTRVNGGSICDTLKATSSECQSNGNLKQAWVNGGWQQPWLSQSSQRSDCQSDGNSSKRCSIWDLAQRRPGEHLYGALQVPRVRLPAGDEQRGLARDPSSSPHGRCCSTEASLVTFVNTLLPGHSLRGFLSMNKDDMGDGIPTDQLSHNHCDWTDDHCNCHIVTSCVFVLLSHLLSQVHRRQNQLSDFVEPKKYWRAKRGSLCTRAGSRKTVMCQWWNPCIIRPCCVADGGAGGAGGAGQEEHGWERLGL